MRVQAARFFSAGPSGLVGAEENLILDCYRLAKYYHQHPDVFLAMPLDEVRMHWNRTSQLIRQQQADSDAD